MRVVGLKRLVVGPLAVVAVVVIPISLGGCSDSSGDGGTESSNDGDATADSAGSTDDVGGQCSWPEDDAPAGDPATITIRNDGTTPAFVLPFASPVCNYSKIAIDIDGEEVAWDRSGIYMPRCSAPQDLCFYGCSDGGDQGYLLAPGASVDIDWNRYLWSDESVSMACASELECPNDVSSCYARRPAGDVAYQVRAQIMDTCPGEPDACTGCTDGVCEVFVYEPGTFTPDRTVTASGTLPDGVTVIIE